MLKEFVWFIPTTIIIYTCSSFNYKLAYIAIDFTSRDE